MTIRIAKFQIGDIVRHRVYTFRGVIFDVDPEFANTEEWWQSIPEDVRPRKDQPFYHLLAENDDMSYIAYVSEQNLLRDESGKPVSHPQGRRLLRRPGGWALHHPRDLQQLNRAAGAAMARLKIPAVFMRGGTSKGVFFHERDLPGDPAERDRILLHVLGSPDPYRRQLDGMGGGLSSLSKAVFVAPSKRPDANVDYTFAQVSVDRPVVDYSGTCGNLSAAVGAFAVDEGLVEAPDGEACVRVYMTITGKIYQARFPVKDGMAVEKGDFVMPGVGGSGAKVTLDYLDPGGAVTGALLPTGHARDHIEVEGLGRVEVSLVDATNAVVFVDAADMGYQATELPEALDADPDFMSRMDEVRRKGAVLMGMANRSEDAPLSAPKVGIIGPPAAFTALDGTQYGPDDMDLSFRVISMENVHRAVPGTNGMCIAAAARIEGTIPQRLARDHVPIRVGNPSGVLPVDADVSREDDGRWAVRATTVYRTQRRLMEGSVLVSDR